MRKRRFLLWPTFLVLTVALYFLYFLFDSMDAGMNRDGPAQIATNPVIYADVPDPDVIRVGDTYYMVTTSMHMTPGSPIMKSTDLVNWEIIGYPYERLEENDAHNLRNGLNVYGKGTWANSLKYHKGKFYVLTASLNTGKTYLFSTDDPSGSWERTVFDGYMHDPALLFDEDDKAYIIYGAENFSIRELTPDYKAFQPGGLNKVILASGKPGMEGTHAYKINGKYYLTFIWWEKGQIRRQYVYRADRIDGPYEGKLALSDTMGYKQSGVAQGGLVDTPDGKWYAMLFQDRDAVGRVPVLVPVRWEDGWPVYGDEEGKVPLQFEIPGQSDWTTALTRSDEFNQEEILEADPVTVGSATGPASDADPEQELVRNGEFNGIMNWAGKDGAQVSVTADPSDPNNRVALVSKRPATYAGIAQNFTGRIVPGERYKARFRIQYTEGPDTKEFILTAKTTTAGATGFVNLVRGTARRGEWTEISGTFTIEGKPDALQLFIETPWTATPDPVNDCMDFYVDDVSVRASPLTDEELAEIRPNGSKLGLHWQWNHNPNNAKWSLTERRGFLRLKTDHVVSDLLQARNTLTQRGQGPRSSGWISMDTGHMLDGDYAGLAAFQQEYGFIGVTRENGKRYIVMVEKGVEKARTELKQDQVGLKIDFDFETDRAKFFYSLNGTDWTEFGSELHMRYTIPHFMGYRFALFNFATRTSGGYVDIDYFRFSHEATGTTTPAVPAAHLKEDSIELHNDREAAFEVRLLMDEFPKGTEAVQVRATVRIPDLLEVSQIVPNRSNLTATNVAWQWTDEGLQVQMDNPDGSALSFVNRDGSRELLSIRLKLKRELTAKVKDEINVQHLEMVRADNKTESYDVSGASATVHFTPLAQAIGKVPPHGNPLISHKFGADPYALVYKDRVYLYLTNDVLEYDADGNVKENSYGTINKLSVLSSSDLVNWTDHGVIHVAGPNGAAKWATQSWAPAVAHKKIDGKDKFFLYFANNASSIGVLTSDSPTGPWTDPIGKPLITRSTPGVAGVTWLFDPAVLVDDNGKAYIYFGGGVPEGMAEMPNTARVMQLGDDMISVVGEAVPIPAPYMFEDSGINKIGGKYYYTYCSNFAGGVRPAGSPPPGEIAYMVSDHPMGPWTYKGTILKNPGHFFGVGGNNHHALFEFRGNWYIAYHAQTLSKAMGIPKGYRSPHLNRVFLGEDGSIREIAADLQGVEPVRNLDPFVRVEAETMAWSAGIRVEPAAREDDSGHAAPNMAVTDIHNGDWTAVANVDFGKGASTFTASVSSAGEGGVIELRLDGPDGQLIGTLAVPSTNGWERWIEATTQVTGAEGVHDVYFVFRGKPEGKLFNVDYWKFGP